MNVILWVVICFVLGAFAALLTNGIMQSLKNIPFLGNLKGILGYVFMIIVAAACSYAVYKGALAAEIPKVQWPLLYLCAVASAQLGYEAIVKKIIDKKIKNM